MRLVKLVAVARDKSNFDQVSDYVGFARRFLDFAFRGRNLQAVIVSQNEPHYRFLQYKEDGHFNITRPLNSKLLLGPEKSALLASEFLDAIDTAESIRLDDDARRALIRDSIYTIQQCIGAALDALPAGQSNAARKIAGDLFERLIKLLIVRRGIDCTSGTINVPVVVDGAEQFRMSFQHDLIVKEGDLVKVIGSVKTSSKDRLGKIFVDKLLYCRLTETAVPHVAIFLNDVQRKRTTVPNNYGVNATFLPGHFKAYTVKLNPLDGVYYCDMRPNMTSDSLLRQHIQTIDRFFCDDLRMFVQTQGARAAVLPTESGPPDE